MISSADLLPKIKALAKETRLRMNDIVVYRGAKDVNYGRVATRIMIEIIGVYSDRGVQGEHRDCDPSRAREP